MWENLRWTEWINDHSFGVLEALFTDFAELLSAGGSRKAWFMAMVDIPIVTSGKGLGEIGSFPAECRERIHQLVVSFDRGIRGLIVDQDSGFAHTGYDGLRILLIHRESRVSVPETGAKRSPWVESTENALRKGGGPANR